MTILGRSPLRAGAGESSGVTTVSSFIPSSSNTDSRGRERTSAGILLKAGGEVEVEVFSTKGGGISNSVCMSSGFISSGDTERGANFSPTVVKSFPTSSSVRFTVTSSPIDAGT
jgi:hypothetical protein